MTDLILIGEIVGAVGIKGQVKAKVYSDSPERFKDFSHIVLVKGNAEKASLESYMGTGIESVRNQGKMAVLKLEGTDTRNDAEELVGFGIYIEEDQLESLPDGSYYVKDIIGLTVLDDMGETVGTVKDVIQNGPHDIYVIALKDEKPVTENKSAQDVMVPAVKEFIKEVDIENGNITIRFIEGMLP